MQTNLWDKYKIIKKLNSNSNIKTYLVKIEPILKEIIFEDINDYYILKARLEILKNKYKIYDIIEENEKLYIIIDNNEELSKEIDKLLLSNELDIKKEGILEGHGKPIKKSEIKNLFEMEKSMCKISFEKIENNKLQKGKGTGFFCKMYVNFPFKYALFTNNHILNRTNTEIGSTIKFEYYKGEKKIKITPNRRVYTNEELDYTCIELFESDGIINYFKAQPQLYKHKRNNLEKDDIFILQFPYANDLSFSIGKIKSIKDNFIMDIASTELGFSGS